MSACGICSYLAEMTDPELKEELNEALKPGSMSAAAVRRKLAEAGLKVSDTTVKTHRHETPEERVVLEVKKEAKLPAGWEQFAEYTDSVGTAAVHLPTPKATERDLLITAGFDPADWQISGKINTRRWMRYDQEWLYYYKFDVIAGESPEVVEEHVEELVKLIRSRKRKAPAILRPGNDAFVFNASDWQIGKREGLDGTSQTVERVKTSFEMAIAQVKDLRKVGYKMPQLLFTGLGDLGEGTCGFYPGQTFMIDRNRREQGNLNRELITEGLDALMPLFDETIVAAVGGNHGENRSPRGDRITDDADNDDCAYFDAVKFAFDRAGDNNIRWEIMKDELSMAVEAGGVKVGLTHGHLFERAAGGTPAAKAKTWWTGQDFGFQPMRDTRILVSAHFHHALMSTIGYRTHFQTPAMDPGSKWYRQSRGEDAPPGVLTFRLNAGNPLGWDNMRILTP